MNTSALVSIQLDGKPHAVPSGSSLADLVTSLGHEPDKVATALNGSFVPREQRASAVLRPDDTVLLFQAIVGG